jgi:hypothetical protein
VYLNAPCLSPKGGPAGAGCAKTLGQRLCSGEAGGQVTRRRHDQKWVQNGLVNIHVLLVYHLYMFVYHLYFVVFLMFYLFGEPSMNIGEAFVLLSGGSGTDLHIRDQRGI